jgi:signal transduction histidine kinase
MFSKPVDHPEVDFDSPDSQEALELISQKSTNALHDCSPSNNQVVSTETKTKNVGIIPRSPSQMDDFKGLQGIQKAIAIITQNLEANQIIRKILEICSEIVPFSSGNILLNHSGKWEVIQKENRKEFEIAFNALRNEGLIDSMFQQQKYLRWPSGQWQSNGLFDAEDIFLFPMMVDSNRVGVCMLLIGKKKSNVSMNDLEAIKIIVNQAAIALKYGEAQKQLAQQERVLDNFKQLLIRALKMVLVGELAKGITHEINNPLQIILGKIQMATLGLNHQDALKHVEKQSLQIASLVRTISDISKSRSRDSGEIIEINSFLENTLNLVRGQIEKRGIEINLNFDNGSMPIHSNSDYLRQLILNSTLNAKKRMASGGKFTVCTSLIDDDTIQIEFRDNGSKLAGNFNKTILNYAVGMDKLNQLNVDLGEITNILLVKELGGVIDYQRHESFGNKILIRIPQNKPGTN